MNTIAHAIAYINVFMNQNDIDEHSELKDIFKYANVLSSQEVVCILKDNVKRNNITGKSIVLNEMNSQDFHEYIERKLSAARDQTRQPLINNLIV